VVRLAAVVILSVLLGLLILYVVFIHLQLSGINRQLKKRLAERTRQPISLGLLDKSLNELALNINRCLKAEENLRLAGYREEKKFKEMIADISHDLRTPLTAIKGYLQLMEKGTLSPEQGQKLRIARKHADELGNLIEHFFEYAYLLNADAKPNLERLNLTNVTAECLTELIAVLEQSKLSVSFDDLRPVYVMADREMIFRIYQNLVRNCIQHAGGDIEVKLEAGQHVVICFRNAVKETEAIDAERLFDRFYTGDKARSRTTGLGLAIVKLLAEQMGGAVWATLKGGVLEIRVELPSVR
jgi:signal transduction histidine kinase